MPTVKEVKICRVIPSYPSAQTPGAGLPAYYLSLHISLPTLHIVRQLPLAHEIWPLPSNAQLVQISYPDFAIGNSTGAARRLLALGKMFFSLLFCLKSIPAMVRFRPNIVHTHTAIPIFHGLFGKHFLRARWILTIHGSDYLQVRRSKSLQRLLRGVDALCYVSGNMQAELERLFPSIPLYHTPSGVDLDLFADPGAQRRSQVVMVGRLSWQKGYPYALQGFARFLEAHLHWDLVILGEGNDRPDIESQISALQIQDHVHLLGSCSRAVVAKTLQESKIFLLTSVTEGFPKALLEAAACGTPVVATDVGDCREVSDHAGITVPSKDIDALAAALVRLADDPDFWMECSQRGKALVKKYQWEQVTDLVARIYG